MTVRLLVSVLLVLGMGCGRQPVSAPATEASPATAAAETDASAMDAAQVAKVLQDLTQLVRKFGLEQQRAPKSLDDLVTQGYLSSIPAAPPGKKFAINKQLQVYLTDR